MSDRPNPDVGSSEKTAGVDTAESGHDLVSAGPLAHNRRIEYTESSNRILQFVDRIRCGDAVNRVLELEAF
jgi:hypothetical protein